MSVMNFITPKAVAKCQHLFTLLTPQAAAKMELLFNKPASFQASGLYFKHIMIVNGASRVVNK
jgi:hypothetical protein